MLKGLGNKNHKHFFTSIFPRRDTDKKTNSSATVSDVHAMPDDESPINLLIEIVSAMDLPNDLSFLGGCDPYCKIKLGETEVHRTNHISKNNNPIWTVKTKSLFLLSRTLDDFYNDAGKGGFGFVLKDYNSVTITKRQVIGMANMTVDEILDKAKHNAGERFELTLKMNAEANLLEQGRLALRVRFATKEDIRFMTAIKDGESPDIGHVIDKENMKLIPGKGFWSPRVPTSILHLPKSNTKLGDNGEKLLRVKPYPDADNPTGTKWLSGAQLEELSFAKSRKWVEAGSGNLGKVYVEVLRCDNLPKLDLTTSDPFVALVFEDVILVTDVIKEELFPMWMPWTQRAFAFNVAHPSSRLYLGVFDCDKNSLQDHDLAGRITVDLTNFTQNMEYTLTYNLQESSMLAEQKNARGSVTIRLRIVWENERKAVFMSLSPPAQMFVGLSKRKYFKMVRKTVKGKGSLDVLSINAIKGRLDEIMSYTMVLIFLEDAFISVLMWRGHHKVTFPCFTIWLPVHSAVAFSSAVILVEYPNLFVTAFFG